MVLSSDFKRTMQTAEIVHAQLSVKCPLRKDTRLRERGTGRLEGHRREDFIKILAKDEVDPTHSEDGVESLTSMVSRMGNVLRDTDNEFEGNVILVVSHKEPLSCIYAVCNDVSPCERHKKFPVHQNCEIREIKNVGEITQEERDL